MSMPVIRTSKSINYSLPAPTGGLNVRDSLDVMARTDAIVMDNYIPLDTKVVLRKGYCKYAALRTIFYHDVIKSSIIRS